ncbi:MAG: tetraacyldisaccharide 4'-kinase, partial [Rikenellaceae bacterium]|nr:tetraacyldisaccharide 4'-kinase [Rikenellaceae bacterium]
MINILLWPLSLLYRVGVYIRHKLFDWKILRSREFDIPVVCVGNITVGGTGKTPMAEYLISCLMPYYNVSLVSLGYRRRTKGFLEVQTSTPFRDAGDEPKQIKLKFPHVVVAVCENRAEGIDRVRELHPEVNLIILDDGFQHRQVEAWVNIVLMDYGRPMYHDHMLPMGRLRDLPSQMHRANFVVVTKCPTEMNALDMRIVRKSLELLPYQGLFFSQMRNGMPAPLLSDIAKGGIATGASVIVMAGIG